MNRLVLILLCILPLQVIAQDTDPVAKLKDELARATSDTAIIRIELQLAEIIYDDSIWPIHNQRAKDLIIKLMPSAKGKTKDFLTSSMAGVKINEAYLLNQQGDIRRSLEVYKEAMDLSTSVNDSTMLSVVYNNIAFIYHNQGEFLDALKYYRLSYHMREAQKDTTGMAINLGNIGSVHDFLGHEDTVMICYQRALELSQQTGHARGIARNLDRIAGLLSRQGKYEEALSYSNSAYKIQLENKDPEGICSALNSLGYLFKDLDRRDSALFCADESMRLARDIGHPDALRRSANVAYEVYKKYGFHEQALEAYELSIEMNKKIENENNLSASIRSKFEHEFETEQAILEVAHDKELEKQKAVGEEEKKRRDAIILAVSIGLGLVLLLSFFLFNRFRITSRQKQVIEGQKAEVEHQKLLVEVKNTEILDSITYAQRIQSAILPSYSWFKECLPDSFVLYMPKDIVAGDFYWVVQGEDQLIFAAADCTGHGVPGAMVSVVCHNALNRVVREFGLKDPGKILDKTRELVMSQFEKSEEEVRDGMDIALVSLTRNREQNQSTESDLDSEVAGKSNTSSALLSDSVLRYAGANNPLWIVRNGEIIERKPNKQPIGKYAWNEPFTTHQVALEPNDQIYVFTDGYADQFGGERGKKLKATNLKKLILSIADKPMAEQQQSLEVAFDEWRGDIEQIDDVCVIGVKI